MFQMSTLFSNRPMAIFGLVLTSLFWAGNIYVSKVFVDVVPPFTLNYYRWIIALLILTPFALQEFCRSWQVVRQSWVQISIFGFLGITVYNSFLYSSAYTTEGVNIAVISSLTPLLTFVCTWVFFSLKPTRMQSIGFIFGISGVLVLVAKGKLVTLLNLEFNLGDLIMLGASIAWALYTALQVNKPKGLSPLIFLYATTVFGVIISTPTLVIEYQFVGGFELNSQILLGLAYVGIFPSLCSYLLFNNGVSVLGPQVASLCLYLLPVFTAIISILFLNEPIRWFHIVSQILVFIGFYLALFQKR